jgi:hypothetical protein
VVRVQHVVKVHFDRRSQVATDEWLHRRMDLFMETTWVSLKKQTVPFTLWIHCDPGMQNVMAPLRHLDARMTFMPYGHNTELPGDWTHAYVTRIDSDDLYAPDALECTAQVPPPDTVEASIFRRGYVHDVRSGKTGVFYNPSTPFHTLMFPRQIWETDYATNFVGDHSKVGSHYKVHVLPDWKFCVQLHDSNFVTGAGYSRQPGMVPMKFTLERFMAKPIVFDLDDQCDEWDALPALDRLRERYPRFACTLFTIPGRTSGHMWKFLANRPWIEVGMHGITHRPNEELRDRTYGELEAAMHRWKGAKVFRAPGWHLPAWAVRCCNRNGFAIAPHVRERVTAKYGVYYCDGRFTYWHGHTHDVCGNGIYQHLDSLLNTWKPDQLFVPVTEALVHDPGDWR